MNIDKRLAKISQCLYRVSVKALVINKNKILLVKEWDDEWWSLPAGGVEYGENIQQALNRELNEELGIVATDIKTNNEIIYIGTGAVVENIPMVNLFLRVELPVDKIKPTLDVIKYSWFTYEELKKLYLVPTTVDTDQLFKVIQKQMIE